LLVGYVSIQICALLPPVRLGPPCRRPILNATMAPVYERRCTRQVAGETLASLASSYYWPENPNRLRDGSDVVYPEQASAPVQASDNASDRTGIAIRWFR
jgi:hypothetical protein